MAKVAIVSDNKELLVIIQSSIQKLNHESLVFDNYKKAILSEPDLIFAEWVSGDRQIDIYNGLKDLSNSNIKIVSVIIVPAGNLTAMHRMRAAGATDVLFNPPTTQEIEAEIIECLSISDTLTSIDKSKYLNIISNELVGESPNFKKCLEEIKQAARCDANVLLIGETGTGKEIFAQAIHKLSRRCGNLYLAVNCAGLPGTLLESELFGHVKGAFTGASNAREGRFEAVGAGTLLLDEIGDIDISLQMKLLRVIEQREFQRLGDNTNIPFNARLISATSKDLYNGIEEGNFRRDLLGRIDQFRISIPPLRERRSDISILVRHFILKHARARLIEISHSTMEIIESYHFPMNVRQLENAIIGALARSEPGNILLPKHLPEEIIFRTDSSQKSNFVQINIPINLPYKDAAIYAQQSIDKIYLNNLLLKHKGNHSLAAKEAGIDRKTFSTRLKDSNKFKGEDVDE